MLPRNREISCGNPEIDLTYGVVGLFVFSRNREIDLNICYVEFEITNVVLGITKTGLGLTQTGFGPNPTGFGSNQNRCACK